MATPKPVLLLILDGWGYREQTEHNAIALANCPNWRQLLATRPHALVDTHGLSVGLPDGQMGNSEVGHMNIGAGRIVYQDLTRIDAAIADGSFARNAALLDACAAARNRNTCPTLSMKNESSAAIRVIAMEAHRAELSSLVSSRSLLKRA